MIRISPPFSKALTLSAIFAVSLAAAVPTPGASLKNDSFGQGVEGGGSINFKYPQLLDAKQKPAGKLIEAAVSGNSANLKYDNGSTATMTASGSSVALKFTNAAPSVKHLRFESHLTFSVVGAEWSADGKAGSFPEVKPAKPHLFQGATKEFKITYVAGPSLTVKFPGSVYLELTDTREWGWDNFVMKANVPFGGTGKTYTFGYSGQGAEEGAPRKVMVDKFGQYNLKDWPLKVKSEDELMADVGALNEYFAGFNPPEVDRYGGLPGSKEKLGLTQTGFFHVEKKGERWYLVNPDGNWTIMKAVCAIAPYLNNVVVKGKESIYEWLPPFESEFKSAYGQNSTGTNDGKFTFFTANWIRQNGAPFDNHKFTTQMIGRIRTLGFNAGGAFGSGDAEARKELNFPYVVELPLRQYQGVPHLPGLREIWDPFDEKVRAAVTKNITGRLKDSADNPLLIGYYLVNEPLFEDIPKVVPSYNEKRACKRRLVEMLEDKYKTIAGLNKAWDIELPSFEEAAKQGLAVKTKAASEDLEEFKSIFLEEYFKFTTEQVRAVDKNHMLMGCRLQSGTINNENTCRIGAKYSDVWSYNYYTYGIDENFLAKIQQWTGGKPMIFSEFHFNSPSDSGVLSGAKDVASQKDRGLAYRHYVEHAAALPYVVGVEYYTLLDGVVSGFNANCGIFSVTGRPWKPMVEEMVKTNYNIHKVAAGEQKPFAFDDPRFTGKGQAKRSMVAERIQKPLAIDGNGGDWPGVPAERVGGDRLVNGATADDFTAAVKVCWDDEFLYVLADVNDVSPMMNKNSAKMLWSGDAVEVFVGSEEPEKGGALIFTDRHVILSAATEGPRFAYSNAPGTPEAKVAVSPKSGNSGYVLEAALPWSTLGTKAAPNKELIFDVGIDDSADGTQRVRQLMWSGTGKNSTDRSHWGTLRLVGQ